MRKTNKERTNLIIKYFRELPPESVVSISQIATKFHINYQVARRHIQFLYDSGIVSKHPGPGQSFVYKLREYKRFQARSKKMREPEPQQVKRVNLTPHSIDKLIEPWSKEKWQPRIHKSSRYLPLGIARLYELAAETTFGSTVSQTDLDEIRAGLNEFRQDLLNTLTVVDSFLVHPDLFNPLSFATFLMSQGHDPGFYTSLARRIKENN